MKNSLVFLFIPPVFKSFVFNNTDKISFLEFNLVDKRKLKEENEVHFLFNENENWKEAEKELTKKDRNKRLVLVNYPSKLEQLQKMNETFLKENFPSLKHLIIINPSSYELIKEVRASFFFCPNCEIIHQKKLFTKEEGNNKFFFCPASAIMISEKEMDSFNEQIINYYLENTMLVIKEFLSADDGKRVNKVGIQITRKEEIGNELYQKIISAISNVELDFIK